MFVTEQKRKVAWYRHILDTSEDQVLTQDWEGRALADIPTSESNKLKQGEAWPKEETAGNDYLGLSFSFLDMCGKILPGSILLASFDEAKLTLANCYKNHQSWALMSYILKYSPSGLIGENI